MSKPEQKYHFYSMAFATQYPGGTQYSSHFMRSDSENISAPNLMEFRHDAKLPETAILLSISHMGYMTQEEFNPSKGIPPKAPEAYLAGIEAGLYTEDPISNPYDDESTDHVNFIAGIEVGRGMRDKKVSG